MTWSRLERPSTDRGRRFLRESLLTGSAVVAPALVTAYLLYLAVRFFFDVATPVARTILALFPGIEVTYLLVDLGIAVVLLAVTLGVGFVAHFRSGERLIRYVDAAMMRVPAVGTVYESFRRIGDVALASDERSFKEVKLLEMPDREMYMLGFLVAESPQLGADVDEELHTLFVPLAPNPVMAGFLVHVPDRRVNDVGVSVEEGLSAIVSLGATEADSVQGSVGRVTWSDA